MRGIRESFLLPPIRHQRRLELPGFSGAVSARVSQVWVVEVSGAANPENLAVKVKNKEKQWLEPLRQRLPVKFSMVSNWQIGVKVFIRRDSESTFRLAAGPLPSDVELFILEELGFPWEAWGERLQPRGN